MECSSNIRIFTEQWLVKMQQLEIAIQEFVLRKSFSGLVLEDVSVNSSKIESDVSWILTKLSELQVRKRDFILYLTLFQNPVCK